MFGPAKHKHLAKIVSLENPTEARESASELIEEFNKAKTRPHQVEIKRATILASNRAGAAIKRHKRPLSSGEKKEYRSIKKIYKNAAGRMKL
jgi:hypothetical protein